MPKNLTDLERSVLTDGIDELETSSDLQNNIKHVKSGNDFDFQRIYSKNNYNQGQIRIKYIQNGLENRNYGRLFTFIRSNEDKSDKFNIDKLSSINVQEKKYNINKTLDINKLDSEQIDILNNSIMLGDQSNQNTLVNQYKNLVDDESIIKLTGTQKEENNSNTNYTSNNTSNNINSNDDRSREYNNLDNNVEEFEESELDRQSVQEQRDNDNQEQRHKQSISKNNEILEEEQAYSKNNKKEPKDLTIAESLEKRFRNPNIQEKMFESYGLRNKQLYINDTLGIYIEGLKRDMKLLDKSTKLNPTKVPYDEYKNIVKTYSGDLGTIQSKDMNINDIKRLKEYSSLGKVSNEQFYNDKTPNLYRKLVNDYQQDQPDKPILLNFNNFKNNALERFNTQYPNKKIDNIIDERTFNKSLTNQIKMKGTFINSGGDKYLSNIRNTNIDELIKLRTQPINNIQLNMIKDKNQSRNSSLNRNDEL